MIPEQANKLDLDAIRQRLRQKQGRAYWRSLEEVAGAEGFDDWLHREFPRQAAVWDEAISRRQFLRIMGAGLALAGLSGCIPRQPEEPIVPYVERPELIVPGKPLFYATAITLSGYATGVLAESHEGRPTKIEGNPDHPASLGATDAQTQAAILTLYDPDRSQVVSQRGQISTWEQFNQALPPALEAQAASGGAGLRLLTDTISSPTLASQIRALLAQYPQARWHQYEPVNRDHVYAGARLAFGEAVETRYDLQQADVILALDSNFLYSGPGAVRYARDFASRRRVTEKNAAMNRLYAVEAMPSVTGAMADHRLPLPAGQVLAFALALAARLGVTGITAPALPEAAPESWLDALARDLQANRGRSLVVAGEQQPPALHALAHALNDILGNVGASVSYAEPVVVDTEEQHLSLQELAQDMAAGEVELLVILGGNPAYDAPADLDFARRLLDVPLTVRLGLYEDETSQNCQWHIPAAHSLETWSDARAYDGTATIIQPLIAPLYEGKSRHELLAALLGQPESTSHDIVKAYWRKQRAEEGDFEAFWRRSLHDGVVEGTAPTPRAVRLRPAADWLPESAAAGRSGLELNLRPDPNLYDGRFANNGWLQELPKPVTKLTWDNAALLSPRTAEQLGVGNEDRVELRLGERALAAAVWIVPGHAEGSVTLHLGYGRQYAGQVGNGAGFNAYTLRSMAAPWIAPGLQVRKIEGQHRLATTQHHHSMEGRHLIMVGSQEEYRQNPGFVHEVIHAPGPEESLYAPYEYDGYAWGMSIDLNTCTGCNACVLACQSENNIPVVGKEQVLRGREMHWIRLDRYFEGELDSPQTLFQPVPCMHCEDAPCEVVCPVAATVHSDEGLNDMIYNRCVGTRYCSNNCPYKVRRFNFLQFADYETESLKAMRNPDVTVRSRGVMEKCTYCVQRISHARIEAEREGRAIGDGEIVTACQQACPTQAIVFGDINDDSSQVARLKAQPQNYDLLAEVGTRPRTSYLAKLRNPNPEIEPA